jgi:hypothetical protein
MKLPALLLATAALFSASCFSAAKWNTAQIAQIRKRAAFVLSCDEEDLEIVEVERGADGRVRTLRVIGCDKKATYVIAKPEKGSAAPTWKLEAGRLHAQR